MDLIKAPGRNRNVICKAAQYCSWACSKHNVSWQQRVYKYRLANSFSDWLHFAQKRFVSSCDATANKNHVYQLSHLVPLEKKNVQEMKYMGHFCRNKKTTRVFFGWWISPVATTEAFVLGLSEHVGPRKNGLLRHRSGGGLRCNGRCEATTDHLEFTGSGARETGGQWTHPVGWFLLLFFGPFEKVGKWSCWSNKKQSWNDQEI